MHQPNRSRIGLRAALAITASIAMACTGTTIGEILENPQGYANQEITVTGTVVESFSLMGNGAFRLDDGTGMIWIVSDLGVPSEGSSNVRVRATVSTQLDLEPLGVPLRLGAGPLLVATSLSSSSSGE